MSLRIWIDDERPMPEGYDVWCKCFSEFHAYLRHLAGDRISHVSFDYVLLNDPSWPRPHEKHGDKCVELFCSYDHLHAEDVTVEFHSSDKDYNDLMEKVWNDIRSYRK